MKKQGTLEYGLAEQGMGEHGIEKSSIVKRCIIIVSSVALVLVLSAVVYTKWKFRPVTGQVADRVYREGEKGFFRQETYGMWNRGELKELPQADEYMGADLRSYDVSAFELSQEMDLLKDVTFDTATVWPKELPEGFDPQKIMELGKNPGLGVRRLHEKGITGKGVNIAIVDQGLNPDHAEYRGSLMSYELLHSCDKSAQMHGAAVTSIAVGQSCGVAPDARVYYISSTFGTYSSMGMRMDLNYMADSIDRILEINELMPPEEKIRVISISRGFSTEKGAGETRGAIERAKAAGVFVITTATEDNYGFQLMGLGREYMDDPDDVDSYGPGLFWSDYFYENPDRYSPDHMLMVPMDARTIAEWTGENEYQFGASGGLSWSVPWLAGMYALCVQADHGLTPEVFIEKAFETGVVRTLTHDDKEYRLGTIIDPEALIESVQGQNTI